ncbi:hypothetical protein HUJ05_007606 [Dendroctonus ponderosae]|nr:hypothetical protein HUJ05_007606 [Dendroctonus ponderosae]
MTSKNDIPIYENLFQQKKDYYFERVLRYHHSYQFLATGDSFSTIGHSYRVGLSTVGLIVKEVCEAICTRMGLYLPVPTKEIWESSAE